MSPERTTLRVPELPESVADATVVALHKKAGERVRRDELLVELETDKVVLEVPAPADGVLDEFTVEEGAVVEADAVLGFITPGAAGETTDTAGSEGDAEPRGETAATTSADRPDADKASTETGDRGPGEAPPPSPAVRRLLAEHDVDASEIEGTGQNGRLLKQDVERFLARREEIPEPPAADTATTGAREEAKAEPAPAARPEREPPRAPAPTPTGARSEERVAMSRLRTRIAERLLQAKQTTAMLTTFNEVDLTEVMALRSRHRDAFEKRHGVRLGFMGFFVAACALALRRFPVVNAALDGNEIVYHHYSDVGIAVSSPRGLVVPVLRDVGHLSLAAIEQQIREFAERARDGKLELDDLRGGTFTITNGGVFGSLLSTPILNPPQSAILGMHKVQERPVALNGEVVIRPMMYLALSYDHRLIDGSDAVRFLVAVKESLEDPGRMLLDL
ncbi:2-oxoglutarate dehydrogenase complex dihydrolipoyllysine-residue succinyltransferase [Thioalkalivibrio sp.]|uniref:2-oxoglutarate dehydrogenase complex dihydrolipoyllysine-residue succinyltransferase n=1 Tax=Thioalkalivibrio sp. TaxID=2093813 RepID=UPI0012D52BDC|nr:2-oxoglutarate dehydrogenase complex dihydrolipoyllysine-residue succinyltransferase [Thioalkalivibrio sp.]TVP77721.1 MAG: 2-oxoglutarate dehydrogenase complex dihydrolipoyllysine-residue succinyltransferase [Thioalkalivibrio sp.]